MAEPLLSLTGGSSTTDSSKRMMSVSNLLLLREQQTQYNSEHDKNPTVTSPGLRMTIDMKMDTEGSGSGGKGQSRGSDGEDEDEGGGQGRRSEMEDDNDHGPRDDRDGHPSHSHAPSDGEDDDDDEDGEPPPLRIVLGSNSNPEGGSDEEQMMDEDEMKSRFDFREQQLLKYQQKKLQMHQDLTAYNTGSLTVTRFPVNGHHMQILHPAERNPSSGKFSVLPNSNPHSTDGNSFGVSSHGPGGNRNPTGLSATSDLDRMSSPPPTRTGPNMSPPFYLNNNNDNTIPNNNSGMTKGATTTGLKSNGHSQILQEQAEKLQRYHQHYSSHSRSQGQKRHLSHSQSQAGQERKSQQGSFPFQSEVKPESPAGHSQLNTLSRSIGNALLNLASLGSMAALQQQHVSNPSMIGGNQYGGNSNSNMTPLNLTSPSSAGSPNPTNNINLSANAYLAQYMSQQQQFSSQVKAGAYLSPQQSQLQSPLPNGTTGSANLPQLILASGNITQGIQGAQLLIPTPQGGLLTQTILTIPITQPASPSNFLSSSPPGKTRSPSGGGPPCPTPPSGVSNPSLLVSQQHGLGGASHTHAPHSSNPISEKLENPANPTNLSSALNRLTNGRMDGGTNQLNSHNHGQVGLLSSMSSICPKMSPCSSHSHDHDQDSDFDFDRGSDNDDSDQMVDGINLDEIKEFAKAFKLRRLSLGLTQTQVGQALSVTEGPAYSQSAICSALAWQMAQSNSNRTSIPQSSMFEKLDITPKSAQKIKPVLERWMKEAEDRFKNGHQTLHEFVGMEPSKKRKRRTSFTPQALEILNTHFERNTHPSGAEITTLAHQLGYEREVIRIWFCNKRQALKNTVRMMSKGSSPM